MIKQVSILIPYPKKIGLISLNRKRKVYFSFDNLSMFLFWEANDIKTPEQLKEWNKGRANFDILVHASYYAAKSYCMHNRLKFDLDFKKYTFGLAELEKDELQKLIETWNTSKSYGSTNLPGKKKQMAKG